MNESPVREHRADEPASAVDAPHAPMPCAGETDVSHLATTSPNSSCASEEHLSAGSQIPPQTPAAGDDVRRASLPRWLKRNVPKGGLNHFTTEVVRALDLATVCEHARCPNRMECYGQKTATFMILGDICTRGCRFCSVMHGAPRPVDADEPRRVAEAAHRLGLSHVVITCVTRDDLSDGGAEHFYQTIRAVREATRATIEVLTSDFAGNRAAVDRVVAAHPDVYNHNTETVPRLFPTVRNARADYRWTLEMFRHIGRQAPQIKLKTGLMLGLGESTEEVLETLADLFDAGCRLLTLGQYLRPTEAQTAVVRYLPPEEFERLGAAARQMGYTQVASGPFVRSSYHAREMLGEASAAERRDLACATKL